MSHTRSAVDTVKGYFYQFDYSIKKLLERTDKSTSITIEGIEDVDIRTATEETAIQCKYYSKTEYNHSVIAKPIRLMLTHFISEKRKGNSTIKYLLYGHYKSGQHKLSLPLSLDDLKNSFLTYTEKSAKKYHHDDIGASDTDLNEFISVLRIDINADEYENQRKDIISLLKRVYDCGEFEAEKYYYNNALGVIKELATDPDINKRKISKAKFLETINTKSILFNQWFVEYKGLKNYYKEIRTEYFTALNTSPFDRFFLIETDNTNYLRSDLKELIFLISKKWSKISRRENNPFCPFIHIKGINANELIELKKELISENFGFIDGFQFFGADFMANSLLVKPTQDNKISVKFINEISQIEEVLRASMNTKEIYQFYLTTPFYHNVSTSLKHIKIQIKELKTIKQII